MSNRAAISKCEDLILELESCQHSANLFEKAAGKCFNLERAVRLCRHEARLEDRRQHAEKALEKRKRHEARWKLIDANEELDEPLVQQQMREMQERSEQLQQLQQQLEQNRR